MLLNREGGPLPVSEGYPGCVGNVGRKKRNRKDYLCALLEREEGELQSHT